MLRSRTRLSRFSTDQASSPMISARTMRPLPLSVWNARRTSPRASLSEGSACHLGRCSPIVSSTSSASSMKTSSSSSSTGSSSAGGGNRLGGTSRAGGLIASTGAAMTSSTLMVGSGVIEASMRSGSTISGMSNAAISASSQANGWSSERSLGAVDAGDNRSPSSSLCCGKDISCGSGVSLDCSSEPG